MTPTNRQTDTQTTHRPTYIQTIPSQLYPYTQSTWTVNITIWLCWVRFNVRPARHMLLRSFLRRSTQPISWLVQNIHLYLLRQSIDWYWQKLHTSDKLRYTTTTKGIRPLRSTVLLGHFGLDHFGPHFGTELNEDRNDRGPK